MKDKDKNLRILNGKIEELAMWGRRNLTCADCDDDEFWKIIDA